MCKEIVAFLALFVWWAFCTYVVPFPNDVDGEGLFVFENGTRKAVPFDKWVEVEIWHLNVVGRYFVGWWAINVVYFYKRDYYARWRVFTELDRFIHMDLNVDGDHDMYRNHLEASTFHRPNPKMFARVTFIVWFCYFGMSLAILPATLTNTQFFAWAGLATFYFFLVVMMFVIIAQPLLYAWTVQAEVMKDKTRKDKARVEFFKRLDDYFRRETEPPSKV